MEVSIMQTMTVGRFKSHFSEVLDLVQNGEDIVISYGKKKEKIAVLVPFDRYEGKPQRILGILAGKASFATAPDFKMDADELLAS
jgi:antitoxin (DNA-binding transcriptional repressor) of toxin-antitoxin stability system